MPDSGISVLFMGKNFLRLLGGLWVTLRISLISVLLSIPLGILFGMFMTLKNPVTKAISRVYLECIRIMPQLVLLFIAYFGVTRAFGWNLSADVSAVIVFTLWGTAEMGDLVRGALGNADTIAPAVQKGNTTLLDWVNSEIEALGEENFFHADYEATLACVYGEAADPDSLVVEGGKIE